MRGRLGFHGFVAVKNFFQRIEALEEDLKMFLVVFFVVMSCSFVIIANLMNQMSVRAEEWSVGATDEMRPRVCTESSRVVQTIASYLVFEGSILLYGLEPEVVLWFVFLVHGRHVNSRLVFDVRYVFEEAINLAPEGLGTTLSDMSMWTSPVPQRESHDLPFCEDEEDDASLDRNGDYDHHGDSGKLFDRASSVFGRAHRRGITHGLCSNTTKSHYAVE